MDRNAIELSKENNAKQVSQQNALFSYFQKYGKLIAIISAFLIPLLMLTALRESAFKGENSVDAYYHIAMADKGPGVIMDKTFPWMTMSNWTKHFSDKELLYHLTLSLVRTYQSFLKIPLEPPFNFPAIFFTGILLASFVYTANYFKIKNIIYYTLILIFISPFFTDRILMLRPHLFSISLMLLACPLVDSIKSRDHLGKIFVFGFISSWSYSNPHFILLPVTAFALIKLKRNKLIPFAIIASTLAGLIMGYLIHPQFPNTFINWKIQCIDVIQQALKSSRDVSLGAEFRSPSIIWLIKNSAAFILTGMGFLILKKHHNTKIFSFNTPSTAFGIIATFTCIATLLGIRSMEYALPFSILFLGTVYNRYKRDFPMHSLNTGNNSAKLYLKVLVIVLSFFFMVYEGEIIRKRAIIKPITQFQTWATTSNIPKGTVIANILWSDFPFLFYSLPQYKYLYGLDPMFAFYSNPQKVKKIESIIRGKLEIQPYELAELLNSEYVFVRKPYKLEQKLKKMHYKTIYDGEDAVLFDLRPDLHNHRKSSTENSNRINIKKTVDKIR